ncbi:Fc.00g116190.m01.CDS01 [Cosmosporella sp. VM-42]
MAASTQKVQPTWSSWIANQALQTPSVMDALLGFSAFHLRRNGDGDPAIREASHKYMARAIRSHKEQLLGDINEANAPGIVACCSLILIHGSVNQSYLSSEKEHPLPVHWFRPFQSVRALFILTLPWIQDAEIGPAIRKLPSPVEILSRGSRFTKFDFLLEDMSPDELLDHQTLTAYRQAVNHLSFIYCCRDQARPLRFLVMASSRFVEMLEAKDPRTLAIVGYFFMLLEIVHLLWWVDGAPAREFAAVMEYLPEAWWPKMSWAIRVFKWKK